MKIYTKGGDRGETGLLGGRRVAKDDLRVEAYGTVDELNAALGAARACAPPPDLDLELGRIQGELFSVGSSLATGGGAGARPGGGGAIDEGWTAALEAAIDRWELELPPLRSFVLPGGTPLAAALHVARATCRRAERRTVTLARTEGVDPAVLPYLNRLSDLLFVAARLACARSGAGEILWAPRRGGA